MRFDRYIPGVDAVFQTWLNYYIEFPNDPTLWLRAHYLPSLHDTYDIGRDDGQTITRWRNAFFSGKVKVPLVETDTVRGGDYADANLLLQSTSHATKGYVGVENFRLEQESASVLNVKRLDGGNIIVRLNNTVEASVFRPIGTVFYFDTRGTGNQNLIFRAYDSLGALTEVARSANFYGSYKGEFTVPRAGDISILDDKFLQVGKDSDGSLPTPDASHRGKMIRIEGGAGVADRLYMCMKKADDTYAWIEIGSG